MNSNIPSLQFITTNYVWFLKPIANKASYLFSRCPNNEQPMRIQEPMFEVGLDAIISNPFSFEDKLGNRLKALICYNIGPQDYNELVAAIHQSKREDSK